MGFGNNLKKILAKYNKSILWLSQQSDISINTLYSITKNDSFPRKETREKIVRTLQEELNLSGESITFILGNNFELVGAEKASSGDFLSLKVGDSIHSVLSSGSTVDDMITGVVESALLEHFHKLNLVGKRVALDKVMELSALDKYTTLNYSDKDED